MSGLTLRTAKSQGGALQSCAWEGGPSGLEEATVRVQPSPFSQRNLYFERPTPSETGRRAGADGGISGRVTQSGQAVFWALELTAPGDRVRLRAHPGRPASSPELTFPLSRATSPNSRGLSRLPNGRVSGFRFRVSCNLVISPGGWGASFPLRAQITQSSQRVTSPLKFF